MKASKTARILSVGAFVAAFLLLSAAGREYYTQGKRHVRNGVLSELTAIAEMKRDLIASWRRERIGHARVISDTPFNALRVVPYLDSPDGSPEREEEIKAWMEARLSAYGYVDAVLVDAERKARLSVGPTHKGIAPTAMAAVERVLRTGLPEISDFHIAEPFPDAHIDLVAPILRTPGPGGKRGSPGALILRIDPRRYLYALINSLPVPGKTAETILARRDEGGWLVLNEPRLRPGTAMRLRDPITPSDVAANPETRDYRGMKVLAVVREIPDSPWHLIIKKDLSEIFTPLRARMTVLAVALLGLATGLVLVLLFWMKRREARFFRRELEDERRHLALVRHFEYLQKFANDIILLADDDLRIVEANERACDAYGYSRDELLTKHVSDLWGTDGKNRFQGALREAGKRNGLIFETEHRHLDGTPFPVEISLRTIDIEGQRTHQAIIRDITERRTIQEALRSSQEKFKILFEMANDGIFLLDGETFVDFNYKTLEIFGCGREEIMGKKPYDFSPPEQPDGVSSENKARKMLQEAMTGNPRSFEWKHRKLDGTEIDTEVTLSRTDVAGKPLIQAIVRDISERKKAETGLREALREKEVLLREIHHRVKNNMQVISSLLSLQSQQFQDREVREAFKESQGRIRSMALVHEKLYKAHNLSRVDFSDYVATLTASLFRIYQVNPERVKYRMDLDKVLLDVNASIPCGLILNEIVLNALKHAFPDGRDGEIHIELREKEGGTVRLIVRDNGIGFPEGINIRNTDTLGLQIVSLLTDQLDGKIDIRNDGGTVFALTFQARLYKDRI